jgi:D-alanyl-lipoteichoic acid acyltransferase DltB (MBOAT superfamily)
MLFPTIDFAVFFVVVFAGSWLLRPYARPWRWFVLLASCVFYLDPFNPRHTFLNVVVLAVAVLAALGSAALIRVAYGEREPGESRSPLANLVPFVLVVVLAVANLQLADRFPDPRDQNWRFLFLLLGIVWVNQAFARAVWTSMGPGRARTPTSRWMVRAAVVVDLGVLAYFKYANFFLDFFTSRLRSLGIEPPVWVLEIVLPIAISFFTFQAISYVVDVGRGELRPIPLLDFAVYLTFFAHLVAGPIVRVSEFAPQLDARADPRFVESSEAFLLIFRGLFKKVVISSYLAANVVDPVFALPAGYSQGEVLVGVLGYAIQIYADFSGYTDIAIGVALLLGIRFPQNFDAPYRSLSVQDFWRRWHMTLSRWLRDYLYIPLGGNRGGAVATYRNLMLTMVLGGLWHGANWTFVIWGAIHGSALAIERFVTERRAAVGTARAPTVPGRVGRWVLTFAIVVLAWVFFRAPSFGDAMAVLGGLVGGASVPAEPIDPGTLWVCVAIIVASVASQFVPPRVPARASELFGRTAPLIQIAVLAAGIVLIDALGPEGVAPFIYFQF